MKNIFFRHNNWFILFIFLILSLSFFTGQIGNLYYKYELKAQAQTVSITSISPNSGTEGTAVVITGTNLDQCEPHDTGGGQGSDACNVSFYDFRGNQGTVSGITTSPTTVTATVPFGMCTGDGTVRVSLPGTPSNTLPFTIVSGSGTDCIPISRYIYYISPNRAPAGAPVTITGENLDTTVHFYDSNGTETIASGRVSGTINNVSVSGEITPINVFVTVSIPDNLAPGIYNVRVGPSSTDISNAFLFTVVEGNYIPGPTSLDPPTITGINPTTIDQGGTVEIYGDNLPQTASLTNTSGQTTLITGWVNGGFDVLTIGIPIDLPPGEYTVGVIGTGTSQGGTTPVTGIITVTNTPGIYSTAYSLTKMAFDSVNRVYLAILGGSPVRGRFLNEGGTTIGNEFTIANEGGATSWFNISFGGPTGDPTFLVTYVVNDQGANPKYGRLVRYNNGTPTVSGPSRITDIGGAWYASEKAESTWNGFEFVVSSPVLGTTQRQPRVNLFRMDGTVSAPQPLGDNITFLDPRDLACGNGVCLSVGFALPSGTPGGSYARLFNARTLVPIGSLFYLDDHSGRAEDQNVVFNSRTNQFMTAWWRNGVIDLRLVNTNGTMGPLDLGRSFGGGAGDNRLEYNSGTETTILISKRDNDNPPGLFAVELGDDGYPINPNDYVRLTTWDGQVLGYWPTIAANDINNEWLALFNMTSGYNGALITKESSGIEPNDPTTSNIILTVTRSSIGPTAQATGIEIPESTVIFADVISSSLNYAVYALGLAVFVVMLYAGFLWITSAANPGNIALAKRYMTNAIIGAVLLLSSYIILYTINPDLVGGRLELPGITPQTINTP